MRKLNEVIFVISSIIFNLSVSVVYVSSKDDLTNIFLKISGLIVVSLIIPFIISLVGFIKGRAKIKIIISNIIVIFYLLLENIIRLYLTNTFQANFIYSFTIYNYLLCCYFQYDRCKFHNKQENRIYCIGNIFCFNGMFNL